MSDETSPDLRALLDAERDRPGPSAADRAALREGLGSLLDGPDGGGGGGDGGGGAGVASGAGTSALAKLAAVFVAGALTGGAVVWSVIPRAADAPGTTTAPITTSPPPASATATATASAMPSVTASTVAAPPASVWIAKPVSVPSASPAKPAASEKTDDDLARERVLLERARVALGRGDPSGALETLDRHATRHPSGRLAEEREVLAVQALVAAGRKDEAQARAARFHREHPTSAFGSAIDALVR